MSGAKRLTQDELHRLVAEFAENPELFDDRAIAGGILAELVAVTEERNCLLQTLRVALAEWSVTCEAARALIAKVKGGGA